MTTKVRKQIYLEPEQNQRLQLIATERGVAEAEIIRQALDIHLRHMRHTRLDRQAWAAERNFIQQLIAQPAPTGERQWRREDVYER
jgi:predicted DNA-binding protein